MPASLKSPNAPVLIQGGDAIALRGMAMRLIDALNDIAGGATTGCDSKGGDNVLLRKGDGVIDGLNKLSQILVRLGGKGRHIGSAPADIANADIANADIANADIAGATAANANARMALDKAELERRIAAEVDRIAAARGEDRGP
jgi:uncharacterized protein YjbI with pentapeptide repeats